MMRKPIGAISVFILLFAAVIALPTFTAGEQKVTVVVMDLEGVNTEPGEASILSDTVREALFKTGKFKLVDRKLLETALKELKLPQSGLGAEELAKVGKAVQAQKIISGKLSVMGNIYIVSLNLVDTETISIENIVSEKCFQCTKDQLFSLVTTCVLKLVGVSGGGEAPIINPTVPSTPSTPTVPTTPTTPYTPLAPSGAGGVPPPPPGATAKQLYDQASNENDINKRVILYKQSIMLDPNYAPCHNDLGVDYLDLNRIEDAMEEFRIALRLSPNYSYAHNNLGTSYRRLNRLDEAIAEYKLALRADPNYATAHNNLGNAYFQQGNFSDALYEFQQAAKIKPTDSDYFFNIGRACKRLSNYTEAAKAYLKCLELDPEYIDAYYNLGDVYASAGNNQAAIYYFQKYIQKENRPSEQEWVEKARARIRELGG